MRSCAIALWGTWTLKDANHQGWNKAQPQPLQVLLESPSRTTLRCVELRRQWSTGQELPPALLTQVFHSTTWVVCRYLLLTGSSLSEIAHYSLQLHRANQQPPWELGSSLHAQGKWKGRWLLSKKLEFWHSHWWAFPEEFWYARGAPRLFLEMGLKCHNRCDVFKATVFAHLKTMKLASSILFLPSAQC